MKFVNKKKKTSTSTYTDDCHKQMGAESPEGDNATDLVLGTLHQQMSGW